jgi:ankyrin repeat protein
MIHRSHLVWFSVAYFLIDNGAIINDLQYTFCLYVARLNNCKYHEKLFTHFLNMGVDLDAKFDLACKKNMVDDKDIHIQYITYILEAIVYTDSIELLQLCLKYGANIHINNYGPLHMAIRCNKLDIVKFLLDTESIVDPNFECDVTTEMIDLLDQYSSPHKLKKLIK